MWDLLLPKGFLGYCNGRTFKVQRAARELMADVGTGAAPVGLKPQTVEELKEQDALKARSVARAFFPNPSLGRRASRFFQWPAEAGTLSA
jgi:hypothetical protein